MRAYMLTIRDACRRPFATITIVMVANGRRHALPLHASLPHKLLFFSLLLERPSRCLVAQINKHPEKRSSCMKSIVFFVCQNSKARPNACHNALSLGNNAAITSLGSSDMSCNPRRCTTRTNVRSMAASNMLNFRIGRVGTMDRQSVSVVKKVSRVKRI